MKGREISVLMLSEVWKDNFEFRNDAEYFSKDSLTKIKLLENIGYKKIGDFAFVTDGIHASIDYSEDSRINLISATSPRENIFNLSRQVFISEKAHLANPRTSLKEGDIILSTVGTIGNCAVVTPSILPANSDRHVGIIRIEKDFSPYFISTFLLSKYGYFQTLRESTGNVQLNLFIYKIKTLKIPILSQEFQTKIENLVKNAHSCLEQSQTLYTEAENLLLESLGLTKEGFDSSENFLNANIKTFSQSFLATGRLDAEYYQPKYEILENKIKAYEGGFCRLKDLVESYSSGFAFENNNYSNEGFNLIRINNIKKGSLELDNAVKVPMSDVAKSPKDIVKENDILISMSGTIGNSCKIPKGIEAIINQRILKITPKNYDFDVLPLLINSIIGQMQLERVGTGGVQTNLTGSDILNILIPILPIETQTQISAKIQESFKLKTESENLLNLAKQKVESAIEKGE